MILFIADGGRKRNKKYFVHYLSHFDSCKHKNKDSFRVHP